MRSATRRSVLWGGAAAACTGSPAALAQEGAALKGIILRRNGALILLKTDTGQVPVRMLDSTKVQSSAGVLGVRRTDRLPTELIPGLPIEATGSMQGSEFVASAITFNPGDLKTAQQVQAGMHGTEERLASVGELAAVGRAKVFFDVGSSTLSQQGKQDLQSLCAQAKNYPGYRLAVVGRADTTGSASANQKLSEARAAAVTAYLLQSCGVSPGSLLPASALGDSPIAQDPDPPKNKAEARRVTVTIAVSKASLPAG